MIFKTAISSTDLPDLLFALESYQRANVERLVNHPDTMPTPAERKEELLHHARIGELITQLVLDYQTAVEAENDTLQAELTTTRTKPA